MSGTGAYAFFAVFASYVFRAFDIAENSTTLLNAIITKNTIVEYGRRNKFASPTAYYAAAATRYAMRCRDAIRAFTRFFDHY